MAAFLSDQTLQFVVIAMVLGFCGIGVLIFGLFRLTSSQNAVSKRMEDFVDNRDKTSSSSPMYRIFPREISGSFFNRIIKPFFQNIVNYFGKFTPANSVAKLDHTLMIAGNPYGMHAQEFYGIRVLFLFMGIALAFFLNYRSGFTDLVMMILGILVIAITLLLPGVWLNSFVFQRKDELRRNLPDALDMLSVCASAGLGFDQSLKKICEFWPTALSSEFKRAIQEMDMGVSREEALRNMSNRLDVEEISSFISIIIQAENIGMSFSDVLHSQAQQMRILRHYRAKEIANSMPAKMIIPLVIFIFPALIAVIVGPVIPTLLNLFS